MKLKKLLSMLLVATMITSMLPTGVFAESVVGAPTVTSIELKTPATAVGKDQTVVFTVTYNEEVKDVTTADFALTNCTFTSAVGSGEIVSIDHYLVWDVTVSASADGAVTLAEADSGWTANDVDNAVVAIKGDKTATFTLDSTAPTVTAITFDDKDIKTAAVTDVALAGNIVITFDEDVQFTGADGAVAGSGTLTVANFATLTGGTGSLGIPTYDNKVLTIPYLDLANSTAYTLAILNTGIWDVAGNALATVTVGGTATTVPDPTYTITFGEEPTFANKKYGDAPVAANIAVNNTGNTVQTVTVTAIYTSTISGMNGAVQGFNITPTELTNMAANDGTANVKITPKTKLDAGTYTIKLKAVSTNNTTGMETAEMSFIVEPALLTIMGGSITATKVYDGELADAIISGTATVTGEYLTEDVVATVEAGQKLPYTDNANVGTDHAYSVAITNLKIEYGNGAKAGNYTLPEGPIAMTNGVVTAATITAVTTSGTATVGRSLAIATISTEKGAITSPEISTDYTVQWKTSATIDLADPTNATGTGNTTANYTVVAADADKYLFVVVTGAGNYSGSATSTGKQVGKTPVTEIGAITGTKIVGQELTAGAITPSEATATATYKWYRATAADGTGKTPIADAIANKYTLVKDDIDQFICVEVTGTGTYSGTATSAYTTVITKKVATATLAYAGESLTYTGTEITPSGATGNNATTGELVYSIAAQASGTPLVDGKAVNVGVYNVTVSAPGTDEYLPPANATGTLTITAKPLTLTTTATKVYDGNTTLSKTELADGYALTGIVSPDVVVLNTLTATYSTADVHSATAATATGAILTGAQADNYTLSSGDISITGAITAKPIALGTIAQVNAKSGTTLGSILIKPTTTSSETDSVAGTFTWDDGDSAIVTGNVGEVISKSYTFTVTTGATNYTPNPITGSVSIKIVNKDTPTVSFAGLTTTYTGLDVIAPVATLTDMVDGSATGVRDLILGNENGYHLEYNLKSNNPAVWARTLPKDADIYEVKVVFDGTAADKWESPAAQDLTINKVDLTPTLTATKVYDGNATLILANIASTTITSGVNSEVITLTEVGATAVYSSKDAHLSTPATGIEPTYSENAKNYNITLTVNGAIIPAPLTVTQKDVNKTGTTIFASDILTVATLVNGEAIDSLLTGWAYDEATGIYETAGKKLFAQFYIEDTANPGTYVAVTGALAKGKTYYADLGVAKDAFGENYSVAPYPAKGEEPLKAEGNNNPLTAYIKVTSKNNTVISDDDTPSTPPTPPVVTPPTEDKPTEVETKVPATVDKDGNANVTVPDKAITDAIKKAQDAVKNAAAGQKDIAIVVNAKTDKNASSMTTTISGASVDALVAAGVTGVQIQSDAVNMNIDLIALKEIQKVVGADATLSATKMDATKLSQEVQVAIGDRPVFNFSITGNNETLSDFNGGKVEISIPYTLAKNEKASNLYIVYVDGEGNMVKVEGAKYDETLKQMTFTANHFSTYAIAYNEDSFTDIANHWAKADIEFVIAKGILTGTSVDVFSPNVSMTRGMFVTALGRLAEVKEDASTTSVFTDVAENAYYAAYVAWAAEKGIVTGTNATTFAPEQAITRQEMALIMVNYAKAMGFNILKTNTAVVFNDKDLIANWASDAVETMQMAGIITGRPDNNFDPTGIATRAEVAKVLHNYISTVK